MSIQFLRKVPADGNTNLCSNTFQVNIEFIANPITTAQRDMLIGETGALIFNSTSNQFEGFWNDIWNPLVSVGATGSIGPTGAMGPTGSSSVIIGATGTLSSSQIMNLTSIPVEMIPAQGLNTVITPLTISFQFVPGTIPFTGGSDFIVIFTRGDEILTNFNWIASAVIQGTASYYQSGLYVGNPTGTPILTASVNNNPILIKDYGADPPVGGNGTIMWTVTYKIDTLG